MIVMKRSEINKIMLETLKFLEVCKFYLPKFAFWSIDEWKSKGDEVTEIVKNQLGWDITDFGGGNFSKFGLVLFTIRNGNLKDMAKGGKNYCEKILIIKDKQYIPMHYHFQKAEDIINRGGADLMIQLYNPTKDNKLASTPVSVSIDGVKKTFEAGAIITLTPGESITLTSHLYHKFWIKGESGKLLIGEVSSVNDDMVDNQFNEKLERFAKIDEDVKPLYLLYVDYKKYLKIKN